MNSTRNWQLATGNFAPAWWLWILAQLGILALYTHRVPLSANYPEPIEATADLAMIVVQLVMAALLGPVLLSDWRQVGITIVSGVPMTVLATALAGQSQVSAMSVTIVEALWLCAFTAFNKGVWRSILVQLVIGGPILRYLVADFSPHSAPPAGFWALSPSLGAILLSLHDVSLPIAMSWPIALLVVFSLLRRLTRKTADIAK